jgi:hypothetical protein
MSYPATQNINQFQQQPVLGQTSLALQPNVVTGIFNPSAAKPALTVGQVVKLVSVEGSNIIVDIAGAGDQPFGVVLYNAKKNSHGKGEAVEIGLFGTAVYLKASAAVEAGKALDFDNDTVTVKEAVASGRNLGFALSKCATANNLVLVYITAPVGSYPVPAA